MPVSADGSVPEVPYTGTYQNGILNTEPKYYDLLVTGNCDTSAKEAVKLQVEGFNEAPNFFRKEKNDVVFAKPSPMAAVKLPSGYTAYVTVTLSAVTGRSSVFTDITKRYAGLGLHLQGTEEGKYEDILYLDDNPSKCFYMNSKNVLELVPLVSSTEVPAFTTINDGDPLSKCPALTESVIAEGFDFGSIFEVSAECSNTVSGAWIDQKWTGGLDSDDRSFFAYVNGKFFYARTSASAADMQIKDKNSDTWELGSPEELSEANFLVGLFYSQKLKRYICILGVYGVNELIYMSENGYEWTSNADLNINRRMSPMSCNTVADLGEKFIHISNDGYILTLVDGEQRWSDLVAPHANLTTLSGKSSYVGIGCLSYGSGILVAATPNGWVSVGTLDADKNIVDWSEPESTLQTTLNTTERPDYFMRGIAFGKGMFLAVSMNGNLASSTNGHDWNNAGNVGYGNIYGLTCADDVFYAVDNYGNVYRSPSAIDLTKK